MPIQVLINIAAIPRSRGIPQVSTDRESHYSPKCVA